MIDCMYVFSSLAYASAGSLYGYVLWRYLEVVDAYARGSGI